MWEARTNRDRLCACLMRILVTLLALMSRTSTVSTMRRLPDFSVRVSGEVPTFLLMVGLLAAESLVNLLVDCWSNLTNFNATGGHSALCALQRRLHAGKDC